MGIQFTNNFAAALGASISDSTTTISLATGAGAALPVYGGGDYEWMTLSDASNHLEIVKVTARVGDTLTVERGQDGTTARAWNAADRINSRPCAAAMYDALQVNVSKANSGANSDITSLSGLTTPLSVAQGGTGASTAAAAIANLVTPGTSGNVMTSNGSAWTSAALPSDLPSQTGNSGKYLTTNGSVASWGTLTQSGVGVSQTWQNVAASRNLNTNYQNSTGAPIMVSVDLLHDTDAGYYGIGSLYVGVNTGSYVLVARTNVGEMMSAIVPAGHYYKVADTHAGSSVSAWSELR